MPAAVPMKSTTIGGLEGLAALGLTSFASELL
ncbi:hypothetical protein FHS52_001134 [Erythromicrobium ramosum]|uniref:Uncharacterized protein n=1 Tax=Erythrobacter ramosus TaxID=35811 RepID=A0ABR6HX10_9SPHN|nr:hypothetical protein [Erythrobacter ramosus]